MNAALHCTVHLQTSMTGVLQTRAEPQQSDVYSTITLSNAKRRRSNRSNESEHMPMMKGPAKKGEARSDEGGEPGGTGQTSSCSISDALSLSNCLFWNGSSVIVLLGRMLTRPWDVSSSSLTD